MLTVHLFVPGAHCGVCRSVVLATLRGMPGVHAAELDLREQRATVRVQPAVTDVSELCERLGTAGYPSAPWSGPSDAQAAPNVVG